MRHLITIVLVVPVLFSSTYPHSAMTNPEKVVGELGTGLESELWIAPNPASDFLNVYSSITLPETVTISVHDILGTKRYMFTPTPQDKDQLLHIEVNEWTSGTYLVRIESAGKVLKTMRFVKR